MGDAGTGRADDGAGCPARKLSRPGERLAPPVEQSGSRWVVRSHEVARQVVRSGASVAQAGFGATEFAAATERPRQRGAAGMRSPVLYLEGEEHREQRKASARFFTSRATEAYRDMMDALAEELVRPLADGRPRDVAALSLPMAVQVAARVVGLTDSLLPGMAGRLEEFFAGDLLGRSRTPRALLRRVRSSTALLRFHHLDVKPAIRARRRAPRDDVISHLLEQGASPMEVLTECVTYAAAGMVTTREFITVAAWHLLDDPDLLARYRAADREGRLALLEEVPRLEPVVGHLYRRTTAPLTLTADGVDHELPVGTLLDLDLRAVNADPAAVGAEPLCLRPGRSMTGRGVAPSVMAFGDGHHRCPGAPIAMMESEVFLSRLFRDDLVADGPPRVGWNDLTEGYDLRGLVVRRA
ncbi:cytochrome P450 [Jannaschia sp. R86511]|uniref:cytochrome P450 n=1 Tax=Jannaschia sp. R86511 TaxID=3093853 RepID=UPI0036D2C5BA